MEKLIQDILQTLRRKPVDAKRLERLIRARNRQRASEYQGALAGANDTRPLAKRDILPAYRAIEAADPGHWARLGVSASEEATFFEVVRVKPRRTASGVATVSVVAKPWPCSGACVYCPNDIRMPKSYLADEPACQRAERAFFDPYLQVAARVRALEQMGHSTDKVELIVLGGSWDDYPIAYRTWFVCELFRALNDADDFSRLEQECQQRRVLYQQEGISSQAEVCASFVREEQDKLDAGQTSYTSAWRCLYGQGAWERIAHIQSAELAAVVIEQQRNEAAEHRAVGLSFETRPDLVSAESLRHMRLLGATKVQVGIQSLDNELLHESKRGTADFHAAKQACELLRAFGFKLHVHVMINLPGATSQRDMHDFDRLVTDAAFMPDEVKLYPCVLVQGSGLSQLYEQGSWRPYEEDELVSVLAHDIAAAPPFMRISRVVRDIPAPDIAAGNTRANLRQIVENYLDATKVSVREIRYREIKHERIDITTLKLDEMSYMTSVGKECFLQWVDPDDHIAGFARVLLPNATWVDQYQDELALLPAEAMIREVHVYGVVAALGSHALAAQAGSNAQHHGLGRALVERACEIARAAGYVRIKVISAVGTRNYYRALGFTDGELYQQREL